MTGRRVRGIVATAAGLALLLTPALAAAQPVEARWQDSEVARSAIAAGTLAPTPGACTAELAGVTVRWNAPASVPAPTGYRITATAVGATTPVVSVDLPASARSYQLTTLLGSVTGNSYTITLTPLAPNAWTQATLSGVATIFLLGLLPTCPWNA